MRYVTSGGCGIIGMSKQLWDEFRILDYYNDDVEQNAPADDKGSLIAAMKLDLEVDAKAVPYYIAVIRR